MTRRSYQMQATRDLWALLLDRLSFVNCECEPKEEECQWQDACPRENLRRLIVELRTRPPLRRAPGKKGRA